MKYEFCSISKHDKRSTKKRIVSEDSFLFFSVKAKWRVTFVSSGKRLTCYFRHWMDWKSCCSGRAADPRLRCLNPGRSNVATSLTSPDLRCYVAHHAFHPRRCLRRNLYCCSWKKVLFTVLLAIVRFGQKIESIRILKSFWSLQNLKEIKRLNKLEHLFSKRKKYNKVASEIFKFFNFSGMIDIILLHPIVPLSLVHYLSFFLSNNNR